MITVFDRHPVGKIGARARACAVYDCITEPYVISLGFFFTELFVYSHRTIDVISNDSLLCVSDKLRTRAVGLVIGVAK